MFITHIHARNIQPGDQLRVTPEMGVASATYKEGFRIPLAIIPHRGKVYLPVVDNHKVTMVVVREDSRLVVKRPQYNRTDKPKNHRRASPLAPIQPIPSLDMSSPRPVAIQQELFGKKENLDEILDELHKHFPETEEQKQETLNSLLGY
jgi:hypothetical protein